MPNLNLKLIVRLNPFRGADVYMHEHDCVVVYGECRVYAQAFQLRQHGLPRTPAKQGCFAVCR